MQIKQLPHVLQANSYPGRGIALGKSSDNRHAVMVYFIMGRSENSRNRVFVEDGQGLRTQAFDPAKLSDPSLVIYSPVRVYENQVIVTNGDQTDTVYDFISRGKTFADALATRTFEPDPPILTPRISGLVTLGPAFSYRLSILKSACGDAGSARRFYFDYETPLAGQGHFIHTYQGDGDPVPSFEGEPVTVEIPADIDSFAQDIWQGLSSDNKVSLFVRYQNLETGEASTRIFNKHNGD